MFLTQSANSENPLQEIDKEENILESYDSLGFKLLNFAFSYLDRKYFELSFRNLLKELRTHQKQG